MTSVLLFGLIEGLKIALLSTGLVLVYKANRFVNLAHAQLGVVSAMVLGKLVLDFGVSWYLAFPIALAVGVCVGGLSEFLVIRRLAGRGRLTLLIATLGLSQLLLSLTYFTWLGPDRSNLNVDGYPLPFTMFVNVDALTLTAGHLLTVVLVPLLGVGLAIVLRYTTLGKAIRASASNPDAAGLAGIDVRRISTVVWLIAGGLSAISAILVAPSQAAFDTQALGPSLLLRALGGAVLGGFTSLPAAFAGGVGLGVMEAVAVDVTRNQGSGEVVILIAIVIALFLRSRAIERAAAGTTDDMGISEGDRSIPAAARSLSIVRFRRPLVVGAGLFVGVIAPLLPIFRSEGKQFLLSLVLVYALVGLSLVVLTGWAGQVSLGQFAFVAVGAYTAARLQPHGFPLPLTIVAAGAVGAVIAAIIGLPALRLRGLTLAVTTLGFAVVTPAWLLRQDWFSGGGDTQLVDAPRVAGFGLLDNQRSVYYAALVVLTVAAFAVSALRRSSPGRLMLAVRDNQPVAAAFGVSPTVVRLSVFALSGFLASSAGVLWLACNRNLNFTLFPADQSWLMLSMAVIGGITSVPGAILGSILVFGIPALTADFVKSVISNTMQFQLALGGAGLILTQMVNPGGAWLTMREKWEQFVTRLATMQSKRRLHAAGGPVLDATDITLRFGGNRALDGVSIHVREGEIVGLIGSNGAGKTTLMNVISGLLQPESGHVVVEGRDLGRLSPEYRMYFGLGRSFQDARLFPGLTVRETVQVALHHRHRVGFVSSLVGAPWVRFTERRTRRDADDILETFNLIDHADVVTANLSTGMRRLCDFAAQVAARPRLLLLDEPTAGVAQRESEAFGPLLRRIAQDLGCSILLVEHDVPLLMSVADRVYCLEAGQVIAEGTPGEIRSDPRVIASYLGSDPAAIDRSGAGPGPPGSANGGSRKRRTRPLSATKVAR